jgi:hypothetical protein
VPCPEVSEQERAQLAAAGQALPDGSYPMASCPYVRCAIDAYGRAPASHRGELRALIRKRNSELGCGYRLEILEAS